MAVLLTPPNLQFTDNSGVPLAFGKVYTYAATGGTFSTFKATYTDASGNTSAPNPVELDAGGYPSTGLGGVWLDGSYDFKICNASDVQVKTQLAVTAFTALPASSDSYAELLSGNGTQTAFTLSESLGTDEKAILVFVNDALKDFVTNGTFATDTGWTKGSGWTIGSGVATAATASTALSQTAASTLVAGQAYTITYTLTASSGSVIASIGGTNGASRSSSGAYTESIIAGSTQIVAFTGSSFVGTVDVVSIKATNPKGFEIKAYTEYTISGTTLTLTSAPASDSNNIYVTAPSLLVGAASSAAASAASDAASALASKIAAQTAETNAETAETNAAASAATASTSADWATKTNGLVSGTDYSAKAWAIGGTGTTTNNAKYYSEQAAGAVTGSILPMTEQGSTPSTPTSGVSKLFFDTDGKLRTLDDAGVLLTVLATLGAGTAGQRVVSAGAGIAPTWKNVDVSNVSFFASTTLEDDRIAADGAAVSRTTYDILFAKIGTEFGAGDGSTTFNVPDIEGKVIVGLDTSDTTFDTLGELVGSKDAVVVAHTHTNSPHEHEASDFGIALTPGGAFTALGVNGTPGAGANTSSVSITIDSAGVSGTNKNIQPSIVFHAQIKYR